MGASSSGKTSSPGQRKSKRVHLPFGFRMKPRTLVYTIVLFLSVSLFTICTPVYFYMRDVEQTSEARQQAKLIFGDVEESKSAAALPRGEELIAAPEVISLDTVLNLHRETLGLNSVQSVLLSGTYLEQGNQFEMKLAAKAPGLVRKAMSAPDFQLTCVHDGIRARVEITQGDVSQTKLMEDALYAHAVILEGSFLALAANAAEPRPEYSLEDDQTYMEKPCWTVRSQVLGGPVIYHLIDQDTGFERVRYINLSIGVNSHQLSLHLADFRAQAAFHFPHAYTLKINGEVRGRAELTSVKYNQGVMPWMF